MASSLRAGLGILQAFSPRIEGALLALCDQPHFSTATIEALLSAHAQTGRSIVAARYGGHLGAPALFLKKHFAALSALTGDEGARKLITRVPADTVAAVDLPDLALDLDTPEDVASFTQGA
jgi:CTP:molybdopterin cytidylyltransferase MocA